MEKEIAEFRGKISRKGKEGYYIKIPAALKHIFDKYHGKNVIVKIYEES